MDDKDQYQYAAGNSDSQSENVQEGYPFVFDDIPQSNFHIIIKHDMIVWEVKPGLSILYV